MAAASPLLLALALVQTGAPATEVPPAQTTPRACQALPPEKIALQLYSLNPAFYPEAQFAPPPPRTAPAVQSATRAPRTPRPPVDPARIDSIFAQLQRIGYRNAEPAGTLGATPEAFGAMLARHELKPIGSHGPLDPAGWDAALDAAAAMKQGPFIGSGGFGPPGLASLDDVKATARNLNAIGEKALARGLRLYVHNHTGEFDAKYPYDINKDGKPVPTTAWEIVAAETNPRFVNFEVDVHWARRAFDNNEPAMLDFIRKYASRIVLYHIKDTAGTSVTDLGRGDTNWPLVYAAVPNVAYYIWEYDSPKDPLRSAEIAYNYMTCKGQ